MIEMLPREFYPQLYRELSVEMERLEKENQERLEKENQERLEKENRERVDGEYDRAIKEKLSGQIQENSNIDKKREKWRIAGKIYRERQKSLITTRINRNENEEKNYQQPIV
jgi:hypothetical protein